MGYELQSNGFYTRAPGNDFVPLLTYPTYNTAPTYSFFNPSIHIPWDEMPKHILEIVRTDLSDFSEINNKASSDLKIPFVFVAYNGKDVWIYLGYNLALGYAYNTGVVRIFGNGPTTSMETDVAIGPSICYRARYSYDSTKKPATATVIDEFTQRSMSNFSGTNKLVYYSSDILTSDALQPDYYLYGANAISLAKNSTTKKFYLPESAVVTIDNKSVFFCQDMNGFDSGHFMDYSGHIPGKYFASFDIPSAEDIQNNKLDSIKDVLSGDKGILNTLKSIPDLISDKIKGLFIPSEGYFDTYIQEYQDYFSERFGLLYEVPDSIADVFRQFIEFQPAEEGYYIDFPEVVLPVLEDGQWRDVVLIDDTRVTFDFLDEGPIATLYSMYRAALWLLFIFLLINLIIRKSDKVFGGGSG